MALSLKSAAVCSSATGRVSVARPALVAAPRPAVSRAAPKQIANKRDVTSRVLPMEVAMVADEGAFIGGVALTMTAITLLGLAIGFVLLRVEGLVEEGKL
eukprot:GHRQ01000384.1.p2 GENE.GHRQ01000384.1~~GHRQ01000384.1.p2  ORF type:complete len:100 (+),score=42.12 GHRQ01000384.1:92-391(+)